MRELKVGHPQAWRASRSLKRQVKMAFSTASGSLYYND
jgi:hypothetical protein